MGGRVESPRSACDIADLPSVNDARSAFWLRDSGVESVSIVEDFGQIRGGYGTTCLGFVDVLFPPAKRESWRGYI